MHFNLLCKEATGGLRSFEGDATGSWTLEKVIKHIERTEGVTVIGSVGPDGSISELAVQ